MKKFKNIFALLVIALVGLSLTGCSEDNLDTNQYKGGVTLNVWGPNPVLRNGQSYLRFLGSNLDQISQVVIPGVGPITNIEVIKSGVPSEIRVLVPKDGPIEGYITLITKDDKEITTNTQLTYTENIVFEKFSPESAMPGEVITIEGDYMNLIHMIEFADGVFVSEQDFVSQDRYKIEVVLPEEARTGRINLYTADLTVETEADEDVSYNIITSDEILEVGTPTVSKIAGREETDPMGTIVSKVGETVTITGANFDLIDAIKFGENDNVFTLDEFSVSTDGKTITFPLPAEAPDGAINLVCRSGVEVPAGVLETVAPSNCSATPNPVKNGAQLTISGQDMDVVASVEFFDKDGGVIDAGDITVAAGSVVVAAVPELAVEGNLVLRMANGKGVEVPFTLVKPEVTAYTPSPANAGGALSIEGTDLDLVASIAFGAGVYTVKEGDVNADGTILNVTVPMEGESGKPVFTLKNGMTVEAPEITINEAKFCYAVELPGEDDEIKAGSAMSITVANGDVLTGVEMNGVGCQYILTGENNDQLIIGIPNDTPADAKLRLISSNGEITYEITIIPATEVKKEVWKGMTEITWNDGGRVIIPASAFEDVPEGALLTLCYTQKDGAWGQAQCNYGDWSGINFNGEAEGAITFNQTLVPTDVYGWFTDGVLSRETSVVLTQEILANIQAKKGECEDQTNCGIIIQGGDIIFTKVTISYTRDFEKNLASFITNMDGTDITYPYSFTWDDTGRFSLTPSDLAAMGAKAGSKLLFYKDAGESGQIQINDSSWAQIVTLTDWSEGKDLLEYELTSSDVSGGLVIQGGINGITKIAIL